MKAIQLISLQHELGMSIGLDLHLEEMLLGFAKVCVRQLGLSALHYYLSQPDSDADSISNAHQKTLNIKHLLSIPKRSKAEQGYQLSSAIAAFSANSEKTNQRFTTYNEATKEYIYYLTLGDVGIIAIQRFNRPIEENILDLLIPILKKLTISSQASIEHEQLLHAIEGRKKAEAAIRHLAFHDELTGLPNRRLFMENLNHDLIRSQHNNVFGAVLFLDINRFKCINDTLGHSIGDQLLIQVAKILKGIASPGDTVARLSGDEFVIQFSEIAVDEVESKKIMLTVLDKIQHAFSTPIKAGDHTLNVALSMGVEFYPNGDDNADDILHHADTAMYQTKQSNTNVPSFYCKKLSQDLILRLALEKELQAACKNTEQFELLYQPQYTTNGMCIGAEALIRWNNPTRGVVSPNDFIAIAEETGLMLEIGQWVIDQACRDLKKLHQYGLPDTFKKLSINVSPVQFSQKSFVKNLLNSVKNSEIPSQIFSIELTESTFIKNVNETIQIITTLSEQGITTSIDDFGTGYSSLAYLSKLPIETLKIDQAFVRDICTEEGNQAIIKAIVALSQSLDLNIIAEGVETNSELMCLENLECKNYQGYYFSRPISYDKFFTLMTA